jgi:hypothetical protein
MKQFKVRVFYNAHLDFYLNASDEELAHEMAQDMAMDFAKDANMSYDFAEIEEAQHA